MAILHGEPRIAELQYRINLMKARGEQDRLHLINALKREQEHERMRVLENKD